MTPFQIRALEGNVSRHEHVPPGYAKIMKDLISENERLSAELKQAREQLAQKESR